MQASTGQLKWRRCVGYDTLANPQTAGQASRRGRDRRGRPAPGTAAAQEATPANWFGGLPIGEAICRTGDQGRADPRRDPRRTRSGCRRRDGQRGSASRGFPQQLQVGPGVSDKGHLYQVGEHSNLYVLDEATLECKEVYYLGHKPGSVAAPPVMALGHLFLVENSGEDYSDLHVLATDANGLSLKPAIKPIRLEGRVLVPLVLAAARVIVVTDLGAIRVFEVNTANAKNPVTDIVEAVVASFKTAVTGYPVFDSGRLWVGNERFTKYDVQTSRNRLVRQWIKDERDVFVAPPQVIGDTVYHLRRRKDSPAYTAAGDSRRRRQSALGGRPGRAGLAVGRRYGAEAGAFDFRAGRDVRVDPRSLPDRGRRSSRVVGRRRGPQQALHRGSSDGPGTLDAGQSPGTRTRGGVRSERRHAQPAGCGTSCSKRQAPPKSRPRPCSASAGSSRRWITARSCWSMPTPETTRSCRFSRPWKRAPRSLGAGRPWWGRSSASL